MDFKDKLILMYLNSKKNYLINDMMVMLGITYSQLYDRLEVLVNTGYLCYYDDVILQITDKGLELLKTESLNNIDISETYSNDYLSNKNTKQPMGIGDIYIPKNFDKKFKLYKNR